MRAEQIEAATKALKNGDIDEKAFLNRVTFHENCICDDFCDFDSVSELPDDEQEVGIFDELDGDASNPDSNKKLCKACYEGEQDCCFGPCGHTYFCWDCYSNRFDSSNGCPMCRNEIVMAMRINYS